MIRSPSPPFILSLLEDLKCTVIPVRQRLPPHKQQIAARGAIIHSHEPRIRHRDAVAEMQGIIPDLRDLKIALAITLV